MADSSTERIRGTLRRHSPAAAGRPGECLRARTHLPLLGLALACGLAAATAAPPEDLKALNDRVLQRAAKGDMAGATVAAEQAVQVAERQFGRDAVETATPLNNLGFLYAGRGRTAEAEALYERAIAIRERTLGPDHPETIAALMNHAALLRLLGRAAQAEQVYGRVLRFYEKSVGPNRTETATVLNDLAILYVQQGLYDRARPLYERAVAIYEKALGPEHAFTATGLCNLAMVHHGAGRYARAESAFNRALAIFEKSLGNDHPNVAATLVELAFLQINLGQFDAAEASARRALGANERARGPDHPDTAATLEILARVHAARGRLDEAEPLVSRALAIRERALGAEHPLTAASLDALATARARQGNLAAAKPLLERALAIAEKSLGADHRQTVSHRANLAVVLAESGSHAAAAELLRNVLEHKEKTLGPDHPETLQVLFNCACEEAKLDRPAEAVALIDRVRRGSRRYVAGVLPGLPPAEQLAFLATQDQATLHAALALGLTLQDQAAFAERSAAWLANGKGVAQEATAARAILARQAADSDTATAAARLESVRYELAMLVQKGPGPDAAASAARVATLRTEERALIREIGGRPSAGDRADPWVELDAIRRGIPARSVLVDIARVMLREPRSFGKADGGGISAVYAAWIVPPAGRGAVTVMPCGGADGIDATVEAVREAIERVQKSGFPRGQAAAEQELKAAAVPLATKILEPVLAAIAAGGHEADEIILCPDGPLWLVPWQAITLADGAYAIEKYAIRTVTAARDLAAAGEQPAAVTNASLVVADPAFGSSGAAGERPAFSPLPATRAEAQATKPAIAALTGREPKMLLGAEATEATVKRSAVQPRILALATHGFFKPDQRAHGAAFAGLPRLKQNGSDRGPPRAATVSGELLEDPLLRCGLALAGANAIAKAGSDDGILTGAEIVGLDLSGTDLVVLSACETGVGTVQIGEGVASLRQAFQIAGAKQVIATLWQVPDRESAQIMQTFYANVARGQAPSKALREAQLAFIKARREDRNYEAAHPYLWAAYGVTGR